MEKYARAFLKNLTKILEYIIAALLACGVIIMIIKLAGSVGVLSDSSMYPNYDDLLTSCFNLIIGVELIRMLYLHTPATVFEVLLFAIARQIIIDHSSALNSLIGVLSIAVLFATKKFLFTHFDETESYAAEDDNTENDGAENCGVENDELRHAGPGNENQEKEASLK